LNDQYKQTPIGKIPEEWQVVRLCDENICEIRGSTQKNNAEDISFIPMELISEHKIFAEYEMRKRKDVKSYTYCEAGDLLLAKITPSLENGKQGIVPLNIPHGFALATTEVYPLSCKGVEGLFLFYVLKHSKFRKVLEHSMTGTTGRQRVPKRSVERLRIPLPSIDEQLKIARVLSCVDDAIQKVDEAIAKAERLKKGLMQKLLTVGIGHNEFQDTKIGKIPINWQVRKVQDIFSVETGTTPSTKQPEYWEGSVNWLTPTDLSKLNGTIHIAGSERKITDKALKENSLTLMPEGSIIISTRAPVGYVAVLDEPATFNQGCKGLIPKNSNIVNSEVYSHYFLFKKYLLENLSSGSTFRELSKRRLESFYLPIISVTEQQIIAKILSTIDKNIRLEMHRKRKLEHIKLGLMNELLTGRRRVKVVM